MDVSYSKEILNSPTKRYCEIYKITNIINGKIYIGQAVSHILNHNKYRPYGHLKRFKTHISEAFSKKKNQCHYLNNAIRKHGPTNFISELLEQCPLTLAGDRETYYINYYSSLIILSKVVSAFLMV